MRELAEEIVELVYADYVQGRGCELERKQAIEKVAEILKEEFATLQQIDFGNPGDIDR